MNIKIKIVGLLLVAATVMPAPIFAATKAGLTPQSPFYFIDRLSEGISLFFTFNPGQKAEKIVNNAEERLAEAGVVADAGDSETVKNLVNDYQVNIKSAKKEISEIKDEVVVEGILNLIATSIEKNQGALVIVQTKVSDDVKNVIAEVIKFSEQARKDATDQIAALKQEIKELKNEIAQLKKEQKESTAQPSQTSDSKPASAPVQTSTKTTSIIAFSSGAVVEMDANGNIVRFIKEAPAKQSAAPTPATLAPISQTGKLEITSLNITPSVPSAFIEWQTNQPTKSKIFVSVSGGLPNIINSASDLSTKHFANVPVSWGLTYSFEIEAITNDDKVVKRSEQFQTASAATLSFAADKTTVVIGGYGGDDKITFTARLINHQGVPAVGAAGSITIDSEISQFVFDGNGNFSKTITSTQTGNHTVKIHVPSYGFEKILSYFANLYVKFDSIIKNINKALETPIELEMDAKEKFISSFNLSEADEPFYIDRIQYESDIKDLVEFRLQTSGATQCYITGGCGRSMGAGDYFIKLQDTKNLVGEHTITIKEIRIIGLKSGLYRTVSGLPVTFAFKINPPPQPTFTSSVCSDPNDPKLGVAMQYDYLDAIKSVLSLCPNAVSGLANLLPLAAEYNQTDIVLYLLDNNFNPNYLGNNGLNALHRASQKRNLSLVRALLDKEADVNIKGYGGFTALHFSVGYPEYIPELPRLLISKGANVDATNNDGNTALIWAAGDSRSSDATQLLLDNGANANAKSNNGSTALLSATWNGAIENVELLIARGADVNAKNNNGDTPLSWATQRGYPAIVTLLQQAGATQ